MTAKVCSVAGCGGGPGPRGRLTRGFCPRCYSRWKRHGDPTIVDGMLVPGAVYGRLTVVGVAGSREGKRLYTFNCECGNTVVRRGETVKRGDTQSCGCLNAETLSNLKHGHFTGGVPSQTRSSYSAMHSRCTDPKNGSWKRYGGRLDPITGDPDPVLICERMTIFDGGFLDVMGECPPAPPGEPRLTIDRIDEDGHYSCGTCADCIAHGWPLNVRWLSPRDPGHRRAKPTST